MKQLKDIYAEIAAGDGITLRQASKVFPSTRGGHPVSPSCVFRWITTGIRAADGAKVRLEGAVLAGKWLTTKAAIERFLRAQTPNVDRAAGTPVRPQHRRTRDHELATAALAERFGI